MFKRALKKYALYSLIAGFAFSLIAPVLMVPADALAEDPYAEIKRNASADSPFAPAATGASTEPTQTDVPTLRVIEDISLVCMVNDRLMGSKQIPVEVDGKTYYGCCDGCVKRIQQNEAIRTGTDPLTGEAVDKARAYASVTNKGAVLYFESEANFKDFAKKLEKPE